MLNPNSNLISWIPTLAETFPAHHLHVLDNQRFGPTFLTRKPATEDWMMVLEETGSVIIGRGGEAGSVISRSEYMSLLGKAEVETRRGVSMWIDIVAVVGRRVDGLMGRDGTG